MITLEEVVYQIGGKLRIEQFSGADSHWAAILMDQCNEICEVDPVGSDNKHLTACTGKTEDEARQKLSEKIAGKVISYEIPGPMWHRTTCYLRIPLTLTGQADSVQSEENQQDVTIGFIDPHDSGRYDHDDQADEHAFPLYNRTR